MQIAYIISAYQLPDQLSRLIYRLHAPGSSIFVHIDRKTDDQIVEKAASSLRHLPKVFFLKRYLCDWGGFGHVQATLEGIREVFRQGIPFDYVVLLTGQDYPIKTKEQIDRFFQQNRGKLYIENFPLPSQEWEGGGLQRVERWHVRYKGRHLTFPTGRRAWLKHHFPRGLRPYGGSSYWCLPQDSITYIHHFVAEHPDYVRFFQYVDVPDELFFQTILMNSPFTERVVNDNLHYIDWKKDPNSGSPAILGQEDFEDLLRSPKLFARKFDARVDEKVLDLIDQRILQHASA